MIEEYPQPILMKINAWFAVSAWAAFLICALIFVLGFTGTHQSEAWLAGSFLVFAAFGLGHLVLGSYLICPNCRKRPMVQGFHPIHPASEKIAGLDGWAAAVLNVIRNSRFRCIHCGRSYRV